MHASDLARLRQAVDASGEVIFMTDREGTITFVNPQFERTYGYTADEVVGKATPRVLKSGSRSEEFYERFWRQILDGQVMRSEFENRTKAGALIDVEATVNPIRDGAQQIVGFIAVQRDVTLLRRMVDALRQNEERLRLIADSVSDMVSQVRLDGTYLYASPAHERVLGYAPAALLGTSAFDLVHPADLARVKAELAKAVQRAAADATRFEFRCQHADGRYLWLEAVGSLMHDDAQTPIGAVLSARDVTERKLLEEQFHQGQKMEAIGRLAGGIAHDFNNVLTAILGFTELLLGRVDDPGLIADLKEVKDAGERAGRLTRQLLAFSRKQVMAPQILDLNLVVVHVERMLQRVIGEDVHLSVEPAPSLAPVKADPGLVEQLLMNLAVNARDALPKGGRLTIRTANVEIDEEFVRRLPGAAVGEYVALAVADTGQGIPAELLERVFEPFFTTKPLGKGTGLGLSTVYGIVKQSGGYVSISSTVGVGTTVTSYFPRVYEAVRPAPERTRPQAELRGTETVLVAEDQTAVRDLMARVLGDLGYTVLTARDGADAVVTEAAHAGQIDLLLSDVIMPGLNGPDLAQRLLRRRPGLKVLYVSGFTSHLAIRLGTLGTRAGFLQKPFTPDRLALKVREILDVHADAGAPSR
ncbi:MAG: PAS domain S-box protein [Acidobacteria bacterium]|nr:PAS domain S-box protein [Acidobacteriota bacterium]